MLFAVLRATVARRQHVACKSLNRSGWQHGRHFGQVRTTGNAFEALFDFMTEAAHQVQTYQLFISGADGVAKPGIRHGIRDSIGINNVELGVDRDTQA